MATKTGTLRHVWRWVNDGNGSLKVLALQQWQEAEDGDHEEIVAAGGYWENIDICDTQ